MTDIALSYFARACKLRAAPENSVDTTRLQAVMDAEYMAYKYASGHDDYVTAYRRIIGARIRLSERYAYLYDAAFKAASEFYRHI